MLQKDNSRRFIELISDRVIGCFYDFGDKPKPLFVDLDKRIKFTKWATENVHSICNTLIIGEKNRRCSDFPCYNFLALEINRHFNRNSNTFLCKIVGFDCYDDLKDYFLKNIPFALYVKNLNKYEEAFCRYYYRDLCGKKIYINSYDWYFFDDEDEVVFQGNEDRRGFEIFGLCEFKYYDKIHYSIVDSISDIWNMIVTRSMNTYVSEMGTAFFDGKTYEYFITPCGEIKIFLGGTEYCPRLYRFSSGEYKECLNCSDKEYCLMIHKINNF